MLLVSTTIPGAVTDSNSDADLGNCGMVLIPGTTVAFVGTTKYGHSHLVNTQNMGHFNSVSSIRRSCCFAR